MKPKATSAAAITVIALLSAQAPPDRQRSQSDISARHAERHRVAPPVKTYRGPTNYRSGVRAPTLDQRRRAIDPNTYRYNYQSEIRYRARPYVRPKGWYQHRWISGDILPNLFWTRNYWITDFWLFGLPIPPSGYVWVRYGSDALLVQIRTGLILQVIYGVYY
jgi:Ni/Co efflux regulator RcnB